MCNSTETVLLKVKTDILNAIDNTEVMCLALLDLSAAFHAVNHRLFLNRLKFQFSFTDMVLKWVSQYLTGYHIRLCDLETRSPSGFDAWTHPVHTIHVPLGDICHHHGVNFYSNADDSQIYLAYKSLNTDQSNKDHCLDTIQPCLADIRVSLCTNLLKLNDDKTEFMILGSKQELAKVGDTEIIIGNDSTHNTSSVRNLGFCYDSQLKNITHINTLSSTLFATIHKISKIRHLLDMNMTKILIQLLVLSKVDYCKSLLLGLANCHLAKLQRIQNTACRLIYRISKFDHVMPLLMQLHWLKVHDCIVYKVALLM